MKVANLVGSRFKEKPSDCVIDSHALMVRGGYMKYVGNGIYSEFPTLRRVTSKIENIIRQEMDAIDGQEVLFPVVLPADLWDESGRLAFHKRLSSYEPSFQQNHSSQADREQFWISVH